MTTKPEGAEKRSLVRAVEHRADDNGRMTVSGYAAVFGEVADIGGWFQEVVARGAFTNSLRTADVRAYFDHDTGRVLGRLSAGTLRCEEDDKGLRVEIDLPDTTDGRDVKREAILYATGIAMGGATIAKIDNAGTYAGGETATVRVSAIGRWY